MTRNAAAMSRRRSWTIVPFAFLPLLCLSPMAAGSPEPPEPGIPLGISGVIRARRDPFPIDPIQALVAMGRWHAPVEGELLSLPDGAKRAWRRIQARANGVLDTSGLAGGYVYLPVACAEPGVWILTATPTTALIVNGEPRTADPYGYGYAKLPVRLKQGVNEILLVPRSDTVTVRLDAPSSLLMVNNRDATLPDLIAGDRTRSYGAIVLINASESDIVGGQIVAAVNGGPSARHSIPRIPALSVRKAPFLLPGARASDRGEIELDLVVTGRWRSGARLTVRDRITVRVVDRWAVRRETFLSDTDGSVQYYAVVPPRDGVGTNAAALTLTCHGAGVEALGQAQSYAPKRAMWIVAPTNRRPFGFDWEDWGRMDAIETLDIAQKRFATDRSRTYLTGHSMGGHGAWHLSATFPDRFAAVGPSAGWPSFGSYAGGARFDGLSEVEGILRRATTPSDTFGLARNLAALGIYILHGDADDNVPIEQARAMARRLDEVKVPYTMHEQPGAGHWWGAPSDPGVGCVDWPAMFDLFQRRTVPRIDETREVEFITANPGVSSTRRWLRILQQHRALSFSKAAIRCDPVGRRYVGTTENIALMELSTLPFAPNQPITLHIDGQEIVAPNASGTASIFLKSTAGAWSLATQPSRTEKGPGRSGPFKEAFSHRFILVYGTHGSSEENAWAFARARYDAETFWYRGNGSPDVVSDRDFDIRNGVDRSVILYGNEDINRAWQAAFAQCPVRLRRGSLQIGPNRFQREDLALLFCYPKPGSAVAYVAGVGGTGIVGCKLTDRAPYFVSGVGYPDVMAWTPEALTQGMDGVVAAGYFGNDWSVDRGDIAVPMAKAPTR